MINLLLALARGLIFSLCVVSYFALTLPLYPLYLLYPQWMRKILIRIIGQYSKFVLKFLGIYVNVSGEYDTRKNYLIISNHLSYIDVLIIAGIIPSAFVTSVEMRDTPFLGHIAKLGGCLFVERRSRANLSEEIKELTNGLKSGINVAIFPEATSTDGKEVIRFRRPLFQAAIDSKVEVLPICLNYRYVSFDPICLENKDRVFWYGDMTFGKHFWNLLKTPRIEIDLDFLPVIETQSAWDNTLLAQTGHKMVSESFKPILC